MQIAIDGPSGAGKSTVASYLKEKGCYIELSETEEIQDD